jgi:NAD(P)-dependent dehydrogenase (short-subunit alcohol dehydrogenase family)
MELKNQTVLVTGGAVRMGRAIAHRLASAGAHIVIHYRHSEEEAEALRSELESRYPVRAFTVQADLSGQDACDQLIENAVKEAGSLNVLINNAAVFNKDRIPDVTEKKVMDELWPNLLSPLFLIRRFAGQPGAAKVVNMLDRRITSDDTSCVPYLLSKQGLHSLTRLAALEYAPRIAVNGVAPGAILPPPGEGKGYLKEHAGPVPLERECTETEIADAVAFLLENDALTGQVLFIDGGQHLLK